MRIRTLVQTGHDFQNLLTFAHKNANKHYSVYIKHQRIYLTMYVYLTSKSPYFADTKGTSVAIVSFESYDIIIIASSSLQVRVYDKSRLYPTYKWRQSHLWHFLTGKASDFDWSSCSVQILPILAWYWLSRDFYMKTGFKLLWS